MHSWHATRIAPVGESYSYETDSSSSYSESSTAPGDNFTRFTVSTLAGTTLKFENNVFYRTETFFTSESYENDAATITQLFTYAENGATSLDSFTFFSSSSFTYNENGELGEVTSSTSSSFSEGDDLTPAFTTFLTTEASTQELTISITSSAQKNTTQVVSTMVNGRPSWTSQGTTTEYRTTADVNGNAFTTTTIGDFTSIYATSATDTGPIERGTVFATNSPFEWLWVAAFDPAEGLQDNEDISFVSDLAASQTQYTAWPTVETYAVPLIGVTVGQTGILYSAYETSAATYTVVGTTNDGTKVQTTTIEGGEFSRRTTTIAVDSIIPYTTTETFSQDAQTFTAFGTVQGAVFGPKVSTTTAVTLLNKDGVNSDSISASTTYYKFAADTFRLANQNTYISRQTYVDGGQTQVASETRTRNYSPLMATIPQNTVLNFELLQSPLNKGFREPGQIAQNDGVGSNLSAIPDDVYYPFTSSVQSGVVAPVVYKGRRTALYNSNRTWRYAWEQDTLFYSSRSVSGDYVSGSVRFETEGTATTFYNRQNNSTFGGHGEFSAANETFYRDQGAYKQTIYDPMGDQTTTKGIRDFTSAAIGSGSIIIGTTLPCAVAYTLGSPTPDYSVFERHKGAFDTWG